MVQTGFFILSLFMFSSVLVFIQKFSQAQRPERKTAVTIYLAWGGLWFSYLILISRTGILASFDLPPKMPMLVVFPAMISIFLFTMRGVFQSIIGQLSTYFPIYIQSFRVFVELLIYGAFLNGVLPVEVTFDGTNYDILVGLSAPIIGVLFQKNIISKKAVLGWNLVSLSVLGFTVYTFISRFYFSGIPIEPGFMQFVQLPYLLLPAFLLPCAIFYHIVSIKQLG